VHEGDEITLTSGAGTTATYRVVGQAVLPNPSFGAGGGHGVAMLMSGWRRLEPDAEANSLLIDLEQGAPVPDELEPFSPQTAAEQTRPADVVNLGRSRGVPVALAVVIGALAVLTLGHALLLSVRQRRRELAVLRSLGADRRWVGRAVHAQASALTLAALAVGLPAGLAIGQWLFRSFVDRLGLVPDPVTPFTLVLLIVAGVLLVANVAAALPARRARHTPVATLLHSE
jgi:putative ABC transport system permease protein